MLDREFVDRVVKEVITRLQASKEGPKTEVHIRMGRKLVTEADVLKAGSDGEKIIYILPKAIVTPLARDTMKERGISLESIDEKQKVNGGGRSEEQRSDIIALAADHGGYELKEIIKKSLIGQGKKLRDYGTYSSQPVDYPDFAIKASEAVARGDCYTGIILDGGGFASAMVANKEPGILAATCWDNFTTMLAREHVNANILCIGGKIIGPALALAMVKVWLETPFAGGRHQRRVDKIKEIEKRIIRQST